MNTKGYIFVSFIVGVCTALAAYIFANRQQEIVITSPINKPPVLLGKVTNPIGGEVSIFEVTSTPKEAYCLIAVSSAPATATIYPVMTCIKR